MVGRTSTAGDPADFDPALALAHQVMPASEAQELVRDRYGLDATATRLATEKDDTFRLTAADGRNWTLKVAHPAEPPAGISFQTELLAYVARADPAVPAPRVLPDRQGQTWPMITDDAGQHRAVRLLTWCPGFPLDRIPASRPQRRAVGELLARLRLATAGFAHPADSPVVAWDVQHLPALRPLLGRIPDPDRRARLARGLDRFARLADQVAGLRRQVLHNDFNKSNLLADPDRPDVITGVIDFGDATRTAVAIDVATALLNQLPRQLPRDGRPVLTGDIFAEARDVLDGYRSRADLTPDELRLIPHLVMARVVARALISTHRAAQFPANATYLLRNTEPGWAQLDWFLDHSEAEVTACLM
ncbi:MAG TPA: phosphotransferase [Streptosporangiaceae bacterium]